MQESLDEIVQLSCFRVPWVCTKPTFNSFEHFPVSEVVLHRSSLLFLCSVMEENTSDHFKSV